MQSAGPPGSTGAGAYRDHRSHFSGDIFLAFSTAPAPGLASHFPVGAPTDDEFGQLRFLPWGRMDPIYAAVVYAVEEAVLNALIVNADMVGRDGHRSPALPHERLLAYCEGQTSRFATASGTALKPLKSSCAAGLAIAVTIPVPRAPLRRTGLRCRPRRPSCPVRICLQAQVFRFR